MVARLRDEPAPVLAQRLDRLARLRSVVADNEERFRQAISADFGSGTGTYHGEWGFKTFSKLKPVFYRSRFNRLADLHPPYSGKIGAAGEADAVHGAPE